MPIEQSMSKYNKGDSLTVFFGDGHGITAGDCLVKDMTIDMIESPDGSKIVSIHIDAIVDDSRFTSFSSTVNRVDFDGKSYFIP